MIDYTIGDTIERFQNGSNDGMDIGDSGVCVEFRGGSVFIKLKNGFTSSGDRQNYRKVFKLNNSMNIKDKFTLAFKKEPEKSFRKAGITNGDDFLTEDGTQIFLGFLLKKHGEEFKKEVVDDLLKDIESEDK